MEHQARSAIRRLDVMVVESVRASRVWLLGRVIDLCGLIEVRAVGVVVLHGTVAARTNLHLGHALTRLHHRQNLREALTITSDSLRWLTEG